VLSSNTPLAGSLRFYSKTTCRPLQRIPQASKQRAEALYIMPGTTTVRITLQASRYAMLGTPAAAAGLTSEAWLAGTGDQVLDSALRLLAGPARQLYLCGSSSSTHTQQQRGGSGGGGRQQGGGSTDTRQAAAAAQDAEGGQLQNQTAGRTAPGTQQDQLQNQTRPGPADSEGLSDGAAPTASEQLAGDEVQQPPPQPAPLPPCCCSHHSRCQCPASSSSTHCGQTQPALLLRLLLQLLLLLLLTPLGCQDSTWCRQLPPSSQQCLAHPPAPLAAALSHLQAALRPWP
jgi:hypothetical protein